MERVELRNNKGLFLGNAELNSNGTLFINGRKTATGVSDLREWLTQNRPQYTVKG
jgi:hypothetical protein